MTMNFAGLTPSEVTALGGQLDVIERLIQMLANISDPKKLEANARLCKQAQSEALAAMAQAADAQRLLDQAKSDLDRMSTALDARGRELDRREIALNAREIEIAKRESLWAETVAHVRRSAA